MEANAEEAIPRPVTEEQQPCRICGEPIDLRKLCAIWPDGQLAHYSPCYDGNWLDVGIAAGVTRRPSRRRRRCSVSSASHDAAPLILRAFLGWIMLIAGVLMLLLLGSCGNAPLGGAA
jgi:hypothetical protein